VTSTALTGSLPRSNRIAAKGDAVLGVLMATPILLTMVALVFFPLAQTMWDSLHRINPMQAGTPFVGLTNYTNMLTDRDVGLAWTNTFTYVVIAVTVETVIGVLAAALINQVKFGRQWLLAAIILPWALPGVVNSVIWLWIYQPGAGC
jgi:multiple sugar transport system permease protein